MYVKAAYKCIHFEKLIFSTRKSIILTSGLFARLKTTRETDTLKNMKRKHH